MYGMVRARVHWKQLYSLHKDMINLLMPIPNNFMDYAHKWRALRLLPLNKQLLFKKCVLMRKKKKKKKKRRGKQVVHDKTPQYLRDHTIHSECLHIHENKYLLTR